MNRTLDLPARKRTHLPLDQGLVLDSICSKWQSVQTRCTITGDVKNSTEASLQIKCSKLQLRNRTESCEEVQNNIIKSKSNPNPSQS